MSLRMQPKIDVPSVSSFDCKAGHIEILSRKIKFQPVAIEILRLPHKISVYERLVLSHTVSLLFCGRTRGPYASWTNQPPITRTCTTGSTPP